MAIEIFCPHCYGRQMGTEAQLGKAVVCTDSNCGHSFIAMVEERSNPEHAFSYDQFEVEVMKNDRPTPVPISDLRDTKSDRAAKTIVQRRTREAYGDATPTRCRFVSIGRTMVYGGLLILLAGAVFPATSISSQISTGPVAPPAELFSMSMACTKLTIVIMGMAVMISGAATWSGSSTGPTSWDVAALKILMLLVVLCVLSFVGMTVAPRVL